MANIAPVNAGLNDNTLAGVNPSPLPMYTGTPITDQMEVIGANLEQAAKQIDYNSQANALGAFSTEANKLVTGTVRYKQKVNDILNGMAGTEDRQVFVKFQSALDALKAGETQGIYTPSDAMLRLNSLNKDFQIRYPRYADKIRQVAQAYHGELGSAAGGGGGGTQDPVQEERDKLVREAISTGRTVPEQVMHNAAMADATYAQAKAAELNVVEGMSLTRPEVRMAHETTAATVLSDITNAASNYLKTGQPISDKQLTGLTLQIEQSKQALRRDMIAQYHGTDLTLVDQEINRIFGSSEAFLKTLTSNATIQHQADVADAQKRIVQDNGFMFLHKMFGVVALGFQTPEGAASLYTGVAETMKRLSVGLGPAIEQEAKLDPLKAMYLAIIRNPEFGGEMVGHATVDASTAIGQNPESDASGTAVGEDPQAKVTQNIAVQSILALHEPKQAEQAMITYMHRNNPIGVLADNIRQIAPFIRRSPEVRSSIMKSFEQDLSHLVADLPPDRLDNISFENGKFWYTPTQSEHVLTNPYLSIGGYNPAGIPSGQFVVNHLNNFMTLMSAFPVTEGGVAGQKHQDVVMQKLHEALLAKSTGLNEYVANAAGRNVYDITPDLRITKNGVPADTLSSAEIPQVVKQLTAKHPDYKDTILAMFTPASGPATPDNPKDTTVPVTPMNPLDYVTASPVE